MSALSNPQSKIAATLREEAKAQTMIERRARHAKWLEQQTTFRRGGWKNRQGKQSSNKELILKVNQAEKNGEWVTITSSGKKLETGAAKSSRREGASVLEKNLQKKKRTGFEILQADDTDSDDSDSDDSDRESTERGRDWKKSSNRGTFQSPIPTNRNAESVVRAASTWADVARDPAPVTSESIRSTMFTTTLKNGSWADEMDSDSDEED